MKRFNIMFNVGHAKYVVNFHNGIKQHADGSDVFDLRIFSNKKKLGQFTKGLIDNGYLERG